MVTGPFFDISNIWPSMVPSITGNDFKDVISKVSDTRGHLELNIAYIKKRPRGETEDPMRLRIPQTRLF